MVVYADLYFVLNFSIDFLVCLIYVRVMRINTRMLRLLAAAFFGAAASLTDIISDSSFVTSLLAFVCPAIMIFVVSGKQSFVFYIKSYVLIFGISFVMGGIIFSLSQNFSSPVIKKLPFVLLFCALFFCFYFFDIFNQETVTKNVEIEVKRGARTEKYRLLCDSGCLVREPFSGLPVILLSPSAFDRLFNKHDMLDQSFCIRYKRRPVPIKTASGSTVVFAVMPDEITYIFKNKKSPCSAMLARAENDSFAGYDGIFPESII